MPSMINRRESEKRVREECRLDAMEPFHVIGLNGGEPPLPQSGDRH